jgi:hypothetical protein
MTTHRFSLVLIGLVFFVAACESAESKRMKALAGDYVSEYETDPATDPGHMHVHERHTLTLRPDGTWSTTHLAEVDGRATPVQPDQGTYRIQGTTLSTRETEQSPAGHYTISGDTLWIIASDKVALTKAVTGIDMSGGNNEQGFLVRQH